MALRINTNVAALSAQRSLSNSQRELDKSMKQIATGDRFAGGGEGAADVAISANLNAQIRSQKAAQNNAANATSFVQIAEGGLNEQNNILIRLRELSVQSASDTYSNTERGMVDTEFQQLVQEFDRIAKTTQFGSTKLLSGDNKNFEFQIGAYGSSNDKIQFKSDANTTASELDIAGLSVSDKGDARDSLETIDEALVTIAGARAKFGAVQSRLESVVNNSETLIENLSSAKSRIGDTDYAQAASNMFKQQAMTQYQTSVLAQANQLSGSVLRLLS